MEIWCACITTDLINRNVAGVKSAANAPPPRKSVLTRLYTGDLLGLNHRHDLIVIC